MALELYMLGLIVKDINASLTFYRRLGLAIPEGSEEQTHVQIKMQNDLTLFLDSRPTRWDPAFVAADNAREASQSYSSVLEFYLETQEAVDAKYAELVQAGYQGLRAPYQTGFGMQFALINDPDGNTILLSGEIKAKASAQTS